MSVVVIDGTLARLGDAEEVLDRVWDAGFAREETLTVDEWADRHRFLVDKIGAASGRWKTSRTPYLRRIMRAVTDPEVRRISVMSASQVGKTETWMNALLWHIDCQPVPTLIVYPDEKAGRSFNKDRLLPTIRASPRTARHLTGAPHDEKALQIDLDRMSVWFGWSHSRASVASRPIGLVIKDELDEFAPGASDRADQRTKTFPSPTIMEISTPTLEDEGIHRQFMKGTREEYHVPCPLPGCGHFQVLRFERVRWGSDGQRGLGAHPAVVEATAHYVCEKCEGAIDEGHKPWMLERGVWVAEEMRVVGAHREGEEPTLRPKAEGAAAEGVQAVRNSHVSFHLGGLLSPFPGASWGKIAREFVEAGGEPAQDWVNGALGEPWRKAGQRQEEWQLLASAAACPVEYALGTVPPGSLLLTGAIDVQLDRAYYEVVAWGFDSMPVPALVDCGVVECPEIPDEAFLEKVGPRGGTDAEARAAMESFALVERLLSKEYPALGRDGRKLAVGVHKWVIDANYRTTQVYHVCRRHWPKLSPIIGRTRNNTAVAAPASESVIDRFPDGRPLPGGLPLLIVNPDYWKDVVYAGMWRPKELPGAWLWPRDLPHAYARQMTSEERVVKTTARGAAPAQWVKRKGRHDNHWWDTRVYITAMTEHWLRGMIREMAARNAEVGQTPVRRLPRGFDI